MERTEMKVVRDWLEGFKPSTRRELLFKEKVEQALNEMKEVFVPLKYESRNAITWAYLHATGKIDGFYGELEDWLEGFKPSTTRELIFKETVERTLNDMKEDFVRVKYESRNAITLAYLHATGKVDIFYDDLADWFKEFDEILLKDYKPIGAMAEHSADTFSWLSLPKADETVGWLVLEK